MDPSSLKAVPMVFAGWLRYLMAVDDNGESFELSPDPLLDECRKYVENPCDIDKLLGRKDIFGVDLFEAGLSDKVKEYYLKLTMGKGSVRNVLKSLVFEEKII